MRIRFFHFLLIGGLLFTVAACQKNELKDVELEPNPFEAESGIYPLVKDAASPTSVSGQCAYFVRMKLNPDYEIPNQEDIAGINVYRNGVLAYKLDDRFWFVDSQAGCNGATYTISLRSKLGGESKRSEPIVFD